MGGLRFKDSLDGEYINASEVLRIPPITDIRELIAASSEIEKSEEENHLPERRWIEQLVQPGSSLGGARPKASVIDENKILHIAKFPSRKDMILGFGNISHTYWQRRPAYTQQRQK